MAFHNWQKLVDVDRLRDWMDDQDLGHGSLDAFSVLSGGTQNLLLAFRRSGRTYVLRRPPVHAIANGDKTIQKEARVLAALASTEVPHPQLYAACSDPTVLGASFYLMEPVDGFNATTGLSVLHQADASIRYAMGLSLIDGIVELARVDHVAIGLDGLGRIEDFLERQVPRWRAQYEGYADFEGWRGEGMEAIDRVGDWLEKYRPTTFRPGIMHGDYHLANVMYRSDSGDLAAIVDWELATIGDPLIDLGWVLATWSDGDVIDFNQAMVRPWNGFPKRHELIERYRESSDRDLSNIEWYHVFACYKLSILLEGTHGRACAGKASVETGNYLHAKAVGLIKQAERLIA